MSEKIVQLNEEVIKSELKELVVKPSVRQQVQFAAVFSFDSQPDPHRISATLYANLSSA